MAGVGDADPHIIAGRELADQLRRERPEIKVLLSSGYTDNDPQQDSVLDASACFLRKPFTPRSLSLKVREALDGAATGMMEPRNGRGPSLADDREARYPA